MDHKAIQPLRVQPTLGNDTRHYDRANILMSGAGSYAAVEALMHVAIAHKRKAAYDADHELMAHWDQIVDILDEAKRKIGAMT